MTTLLTEAQYRRWSFDKTNDWADPDLQAAIDDALASVEEYTNRHLELVLAGDPPVPVPRTEALRIFYKTPGAAQYLGYFVVPTAPPIASVTDPANGQIYHDSIIVGVSPPSVFGGGVFGLGDYADFATVTYTGGFTSTTLPEAIGRAIATIGYQRVAANPLLARMPAGVVSVKQGDLAVMFGRNTGYLGTGVLDRGTRYALKPWRRIDL